ncbi:MAG: alpha/beta hydrolase [Ktedonobacterales bacterium]
MATEARYRPENIGDWGIPTAVPGGAYGTASYAAEGDLNIFYRFWRAAKPQAPVLVIIHGLGAHTGWFIHMGNELNALGLTVYMDDHRGFGRSDGPRGHVRDGSIYLRDLSRFLDEVRKREPGAPITILGHSMGGIFATYLAAEDATSNRNQLAGLILANPWIADTVKVAPMTLINSIVNGIRGSDRLVAIPVNTSGMTLVPEATELLNADSYWVRNQSASFLYQLSRMRLGVLKRAALVRAPALVIQCEKDGSVSPAATRRCYEQLGSADKTWKTYSDFAHDFEFEPGRTVLDSDIADWIMRHRG